MKFGFRNDSPTGIEWINPLDDILAGFSQSGKLVMYNVAKQKIKRSLKRPSNEKNKGRGFQANA